MSPSIRVPIRGQANEQVDQRLDPRMEPNSQFAPRVLLAVDDIKLRRSNEAGLHAAGFSVSAPTDADAVRILAESFSPDVMVVDTTMHGSDDQRQLYKHLRRESDRYLLCIDSAGHDRVRVEVLRSGADDAVSLPVTPDEIAARCDAMFRRPRELRFDWEPVATSVISFGPLMVDTGRHEIRLDDQEVLATRIEFSLLEHLCRRPPGLRANRVARRRLGTELGRRHACGRCPPVESAAQAREDQHRHPGDPHRARCRFPPRERRPGRRRGRRRLTVRSRRTPRGSTTASVGDHQVGLAVVGDDLELGHPAVPPWLPPALIDRPRPGPRSQRTRPLPAPRVPPVTRSTSPGPLTPIGPPCSSTTSAASGSVNTTDGDGAGDPPGHGPGPRQPSGRILEIGDGGRHPLVPLTREPPATPRRHAHRVLADQPGQAGDGTQRIVVGL